METTCVCCNKFKDKLSRILYSKDECELQVIFYYKLPTEMIRIIGEYLYQPQLIKINHKTKSPNPLWLQFNTAGGPPVPGFIEYKITYNCSSCFLYNFIKYKEDNPFTTPRMRNDMRWFNNDLEKKEITSLFKEYFGDIFKFILPATYNMYFYRAFGLTIVKHNGEIIEDMEVEYNEYGMPIENKNNNNNNKIFNNDEIRNIIIPEK